MKSKSSRFFLSATVAIFCHFSSSAQAAGLIMPIYGNTTYQFNDAVAAAQKVPMIAIINPNDGVGTSKIASIASQVTRLKTAKATVAGYISTVYGAVSLSSVYTSIDRYVSWYGATGIFLDEMSDRATKVSYYQSIYTYAKNKGLTVVGNPGTFTVVNYAAVADILVTYEDPLSAGWNTYKQSTWTNSYAVSKFAAIIYATSSSVWKAAIDRAIALRYGWVFVTDIGGADPFGRAPTYIAAEADYVKTKK